MSADLVRALLASFLSGLVEACLQPGCGVGGERHRGGRGCGGEALPGRLFGDAEAGADVGPGHAGAAGMRDEMVQEAVGVGGVLGADRGRGIQQCGRFSGGRLLLDLRDEVVEAIIPVDGHTTTLRCRMVGDKVKLSTWAWMPGLAWAAWELTCSFSTLKIRSRSRRSQPSIPATSRRCVGCWPNGRAWPQPGSATTTAGPTAACPGRCCTW